MNFKLRIFFVGIWLVFTLSLAAWWLIYGLQQIELLSEAVVRAGAKDLDVLRRQKMLIWEGGILLVSLLFGGAGLFYFVGKFQVQSRRLKSFFATFSHDLKTSLTSLRLQAEALQEDFAEQPSPLLTRLVGDTVRLQVQLENSLYLANEDQQLFVEKIELLPLLERFKQDWPEVKIEVCGSGFAMSDARALESVFKNLLHNAIGHGAAKEITIEISSAKDGFVDLLISDDGSGFSGDMTKLGELFRRHTGGSGSGVGLYLVCLLTRKMGGSVQFETSQKGFVAKIQMPGGAGNETS